MDGSLAMGRSPAAQEEVTRAFPIWTSALALALASLLAACTGSSRPPAETAPPTGVLTFRTIAGTATLRVEIAETPSARRRGLMGRDVLADDAGMAFLFDSPTRTGFWMKDTHIPLSLAVWNQDGRILAVLDMEPCHENPCPRYVPDSPYVGAAESNQGWFAKNGIGPGDVVTLDRSP